LAGLCAASLILIFARCGFFVDVELKQNEVTDDGMEHNKELQKFGRETLKCQGSAVLDKMLHSAVLPDSSVMA
jgi:hypothetical protein